MSAPSGTWLCLPTYNERENIRRFVEAVVPKLEEAGGEHHILIIDDGSPDGTGQIADRLATRFDCVEVMHRSSKDGLGRAYLAGFAQALERGAERIMEMDSDFSHPPTALPALIEASYEADLVLGSRYIDGGGVENWPLSRRLLSRGGCLYAQIILGLRVRDLTGGFKCFNRRVLEAINLEEIRADGYGFQIEMTYRAAQSGFSVKEVPITFTDRVDGESKMDSKIALEAVWMVPKLRFSKKP